MTLAFVVILLVILTATIVGVIRHKRFNRWEKLHKRFAHRRNLQHNFQHFSRFHHYGSYREYQIEITPELIDKVWFTRFSIAMINPNRKALRIAKANEAFPSFKELAIIDHPFEIQHDLGDWLTMQTNDLIFSSLVLSDDIRISLHEALNALPAGLIFLYDESLSFLRPGMLDQEPDLLQFEKALDLLCDIKDELN